MKLVEVRRDRVRRRDEREGVTVGRRLEASLDADGPAGAGLVLDHHRLAERRREAPGNESRDEIVAAAGWKGNDQLHRPRGIRLRGGGPGGDREQHREPALHFGLSSVEKCGLVSRSGCRNSSSCAAVRYPFSSTSSRTRRPV